ncbi:ABC transporter ATP-binding protein [soil metagenome]
MDSDPAIADPAIATSDLRVDYGTFVAVDDLTLEVPRGVVFGLVGPNGAGKTSTFRVLASLMEPTYGEVRLAGIDLLEQPAEARRILGYMPDLAPVPSDLKAWEFLDFHAATHGIRPRRRRLERVDECLAQVHLTPQRENRCHKLSRGQTQRLVLAKTLLHRPEILILDEPASGLDPLSRRELRLTLQDLARDGTTVLVSSHILSELAEMCCHLGVMHLGKLLAAGPADAVLRTLGRVGHTLVATFAGDPQPALTWLAARDGVSEIHAEGARVTFHFPGDDQAQASLLEGLVGTGARPKSLEERRQSFEEILIDLGQSERS